MYIILAPISIPRLEKRFGSMKSLEIIFATWPILTFTIPLAQYAAGHARVAMFFVLWVQLVLKCIGNFAWP